MAPLRKAFGRRLKRLRLQKNYTQENLSGLCDISTEFLSLVERGLNAPSFDNLERIADALGVEVHHLFEFSAQDTCEEPEEAYEVSGTDQARVIVLSTDGRHSVEVVVQGLSQQLLHAATRRLGERLDAGTPNYVAIASTYIELLRSAPDTNPSDMWRYGVYMPYRHLKSDQSWKRASGQALEIAICYFYNPLLANHGIGIIPLTTSVTVFTEMGILGQVGQSKLDCALVGQLTDESWRVYGGLHVKSSIAERIVDDAPASQKMMDAGYYSALVTLDMKAFPPPHGDEVNRGELQFPQRGRQADKRNYFERDGLFNACFSFNSRTPPTPSTQTVASRIEVLSFASPKPDIFMTSLIDAWSARKSSLIRKQPSNAWSTSMDLQLLVDQNVLG